ncbi:Bax inhibitor-1/YccA family protein [Eupransor demetentiae]|uniref:Bax inhibitor (BI-1)/TMBIM family (YbhL) n=1 Tax=Eupransor demetentiae TaxID=3109584 RepID=A0ABM9N3M1_9LACO|nr:Bax inhibitor (BI-1)/TMBIM family (YbhL) [Lactobacillaceae bacterium LMG 33000]
MDNNFENRRRDVTTNDAGMRNFFTKIYGYMAIALGVTALTGLIVQNLFGSIMAYLTGSIVGILILFGIQFALISGIGSAMRSNPSRAFVYLMAFAVVEGIMFSMIFAIFTAASVLSVFLTSASIFAAMAAYGLLVKKSLAGWGSVLVGGVIGIFVASMINMFFASAALTFAVSIVGVFIFTGLAAYDTNRLKQVYVEMDTNGNSSTQVTGVAIYGALTLYLDFINLFFYLLRLTGDTRN